MKIELGALFLAAFVMAGSASAAPTTPIKVRAKRLRGRFRTRG